MVLYLLIWLVLQSPETDVCYVITVLCCTCTWILDFKMWRKILYRRKDFLGSNLSHLKMNCILFCNTRPPLQLQAALKKKEKCLKLRKIKFEIETVKIQKFLLMKLYDFNIFCRIRFRNLLHRIFFLLSPDGVRCLLSDEPQTSLY